MVIETIFYLLYRIWAFILWILDKVVPPPKTAVVRGSVSCADVSDLGGVTITLVDEQGVIVQSAVTASDGSFVIGEDAGIVVGRYNLNAHKDLEDGWLEGSMEIEVVAPETILGALPLVKF